MNEFKTGTVEGTGSAINVQLGWVPDYVKVMNLDDAGGLDPILEWTSDMPAASGMLYLKTVDSGATGNASHDYITSNGISAYTGSEAGDAPGFTIGANANINASAETIVWIAARSGTK